MGCTGPLRQWVTQNNQGTNFVANRQQDTADFLSCLFSSIREEFSEVRRMELFNLFGCSLLEEFECASSITSNCERSRAPPLLYPDILPVPAAGSKSITESIDLLCCQHQLRERICPDINCNGEIAYSTTSFGTLPHVLILQLQRFASHNNQEVKLDHAVHVPIELQPNAESPQYILTGAVVHCGNTTSSGHFVSIVRCPHSGTLYRCSDSQVPVTIPKNEEEQTLNQAYMVLYSQKQETLEFANEVSQSPVKKKRRTTAQSNQAATGFCVGEASDNMAGDEILTCPETHEDCDKSLPTPPYTSCMGDKSLSTQNPETMNRSELLEYCRTFLPSERTAQNTERMREAVFCSMFEQQSGKLTNEDITAILMKCHAKPNKNKPKRIKQLFQIFKGSDNKFEFLTELMRNECIQSPDGEHFANTDYLPTPPYTTTSNSNQGLADQETEAETIPIQLGEQCSVQEESNAQESSVQTDLHDETRQYPDFSNMSRQALLDYCSVHFPTVSKQHNVDKLRSTVYSNVFASLFVGLGEIPMGELLTKYGIKPNRNKEKRCGQLLRYFQKNKADKSEMIDSLVNMDSAQIDSNIEMRQLPDVENMSRELLLEYCLENVPTVKPSLDTNR